MNYIAFMRSSNGNPAYLKTRIYGIRQYYSYLNYTGKRSDNPANSIRLRDKICRDVQFQDLFSTIELNQLLNGNQPVFKCSFKSKVILSFLIYQGLTSREIINLEVENVDFEKGSIFIQSGNRTNSRELKLHSNQTYFLCEYIKTERPLYVSKRNTLTNRLLLAKNGKPESGEIINYLTGRYKHLFPEKNLNPKTIRMSVITNLLEEKHDIRLVQIFAGHKYASSTERYKQTELETLATQINKFHPLA